MAEAPKRRPLFPLLAGFREKLEKKNLREKVVDGVTNAGISGASESLSKETRRRMDLRLKGRQR